MVAPANALEPWVIGFLFFLFLLGAASTKDFSDVPGDRAGGCRTLPILYGNRKAVAIMSPFFVLPWLLLIPLGFLPDPLAPEHRLLTGTRGSSRCSASSSPRGGSTPSGSSGRTPTSSPPRRTTRRGPTCT
jgi:4-hydroxybenzoate polyprenyltransferase and related prenyltransferases